MTATTRKSNASVYRSKESGRQPYWVGIDNVLRRIMDIFLSLFGLIFLLPVFAWVAARIRRDSPGPVFYRGPRAGRNGKDFGILKFRTMYERSESYQGPRVTAQDDDRITPFGRWLRDTKLNELPQLWNVLVGEMSMVGPRPEDPDIARDWPQEYHKEVLSVRPGITSPASVLYRDEETMLRANNVMESYLKDIMPTKLRLDQLYVRNRNVLADLDVIFWTMVVLLPNLKGYTPHEHLLYRGPLSLVGRYLGWFIMDMLVSIGAIGSAGVIWRMNAPLDLGIGLALALAFVFSMLFSLMNTILGVNRVNWTRARAGEVMDMAVSSGVVSIMLFIFNLFWMSGPVLPPTMLVVASTFSFIGAVAVRFRLRLLTGLASRWIQARGNTMESFGERVLIVGAGELGQFAASLLRRNNEPQAFTLVGMLDDDPRKIGSRIEGCEVVGRIQDLQSLTRKHDVGLILYAISNITQEDNDRIISLTRTTDARVVIIPDILMAFRAHLHVDEEEREEMFERVLENTTIDRESGTNTRHHFLMLAEGELPRSRRYGRPLSLILFSVECETGCEEDQEIKTHDPQILRSVVERTHQVIRQVDVLGRVNGTRFAILLPETDLPDALFVANRLRNSITSQPVSMGYNELRLSIRMGVAQATQEMADAAALVETAERGMEQFVSQWEE